jgi:hypothetical protein
MPFLFLARGDAPSYRTLCTARKTLTAELELVWEGLFAVAAAHGVQRLGQVTVDTSRWRANASREATVDAAELPDVLAELRRILAEAEAVDAGEEQTGLRTDPRVGQTVDPDQMREILRRVRKQRRARAPAVPVPGEGDDAPEARPPTAGGSAPRRGVPGKTLRLPSRGPGLRARWAVGCGSWWSCWSKCSARAGNALT